jgi:hypothetical protein
MKGVKFGNLHSWDDFSLILSQKTIRTPSLKTESVDIPGSDGVLDLTEFFGDVNYNNRHLSFDFSTNVSQSVFLELFADIQNALHGQKMQIILDEDAEWYYTGRIKVSEWKSDKNIGKLTIDCDCEPYKLKITETVVSKAVSGTLNIVLPNSRKRVVPTITTDAEMKISFGTYSGTFSAGTFRIPELELIEGNNTVTVTGTGNITFRYREGAL